MASWLVAGNEALDALIDRRLQTLNDGGRVYLTQNRLRGRYVIHFAIGQIYTTREHVLRAFEVIKATARGSSKTAQQ